MAKKRNKTRNKNKDASSKKSFKSCDENDGPAPWSDPNHDVLSLVMMQLGVADFPAFSGVCKSWRSLALSNIKKLIVSKPPVSIRISTDANEKCCCCYLEDLEGRRFKTILPHSGGRTCVGFTCGYLVFLGWKTRDFWLVNPITKHELYFPNIPTRICYKPELVGAILIFSPSISGLVFVVFRICCSTIWFCAAGTQAWNHLSSDSPILDLRAFKGKIYTLDCFYCLYEMRLDPKPKLTLLETKNNLWLDECAYEFESSGENFYLLSRYPYKVKELDFGEMKWVSPEKKIVENGFPFAYLKYGCPIKTGSNSWADPRSQYERYASSIDTTNKS